ncbi:MULTISPECIES: S1 family peptidase [Streptomyces]|uniref:S1 family peptidase n=1 Tax=Streptomyces TaxID=1883 RepID=UPI001FCB044F|nr:S1 family peptidase [Streptomyces sp. CAI-85]
MAVAAAGITAVTVAAILLPNANASQTPSTSARTPSATTLSAASAGELAARFASRFGQSVAGSYYDASKKQLVVNVVNGDEDVADLVRKAGGLPRLVEHSGAELDAAAKKLKQRATIPGTSWAVDPVTNQIQVTADSTVTGAKWDKLEAVVESLGAGTARIEKSADRFTLMVAGGDAIFSARSRCSLGFNVVRNGAPAFLTAGHCTVGNRNWSDRPGRAPIATAQATLFPGRGDFALVTYNNPNTVAPSTVNLGGGRSLRIVRAANATVGQTVSRMGSTTGLRSGRVTALNATVNYPEGTVTGLIRTTVCAEPGDSGGAMFSGNGSAIGLTSGGSGNCRTGGTTFFQPVTTALAAVGATLGTG